MNAIGLKILCCFLLLSTLIKAQTNDSVKIECGGNGIYLLSKGNWQAINHSANNAVKWRIERKEQKESHYTIIKRLTAVSTYTEFAFRLKAAFADCPFQVDTSSYNATVIWNDLQTNNEKAKTWLATIPVALALGTMYLDRTAIVNSTYTYKWCIENAKSTTLTEMHTSKLTYAKVSDLANSKFLSSASTISGCTTYWQTSIKNKEAKFLLWRLDSATQTFQNTNAKISLKPQQDKLVIEAYDNRANYGTLVHYRLEALTSWGCIGAVSNTATVGTYELTNQFMPTNFEVKNSDSIAALALTWTLPFPKYIKSILLQKSDKKDGAYHYLAELPATAKSYLDFAVNSTSVYYYKIQLRGYNTGDSKWSDPVRAVYFNPFAPAPPKIISYQGIHNGCKITIQANTKGIQGFRVFRNTTFDPTMHQIIAFIKNDDSQIEFVDSSSVLNGKTTYGYCFKAIADGALESSNSDTIFVHPLIKSLPPTPIDVEVIALNNGIKLIWKDMRIMDESIIAYQLYYRLVGRTDAWTKVDALLPATVNSFTDTILQHQNDEFALSAIDGNNTCSAMSPAVHLPKMKIEVIEGIQNLSAFNTKEGVKISWTPLDINTKGSYCIYRYLRNGKPELLAKIPYTEIPEYLDSKVLVGKRYFYTVRFMDESKNESLPSNEVSIVR